MKSLKFLLLLCILSVSKSGFSSKKTNSQIYLDSIYTFTQYSYTDTSLANNHLNSLKNQLTTNQYKYKDGIINFYTGVIYNGLNNTKEALNYFEKAIQSIKLMYAKDVDATYIYFCIELHRSNLLAINNQPIKALEILYDLEIVLLEINPDWLIDVYNNISSIYSDMQEYFLMSKYLDKAIACLNENSPLETILTLRLNKAAVEYDNGNYFLCLQILNAISDSVFLQKNTFLELEEMYWTLVATCSYQSSNYMKCSMAIHKYESTYKTDLYCNAKINETRALLNNKNNGKTQTYIQQSEKSYKQLHSCYYLREFYANILPIFKQNKDSLLKYYSLLTLYQDSLSDSKFMESMISMENKATVYKLDKKYKNLQLKYIYQGQITKNRSISLILSILFIVLILLISVIIHRKNLKLNFQVRKLIEKNHTLYLNRTEIDKNRKTPTQAPADLIRKWEKLVLQEKKFKEPNTNLGAIAKHLKTNTSYLSESLNSYYGKNFNKIINEYRIIESLNFFHDTTANIYTVEYVANSVGFKSTSAFYTSFKDFTGVTPGTYLKQVKINKTNQ